MLNWIKATFLDAEGLPSSKRQFAAILIVATIIAVFLDKEGASVLGFLAGGLLGITEVRNIGTKREK